MMPTWIYGYFPIKPLQKPEGKQTMADMIFAMGRKAWILWYLAGEGII
jgi:hypothetical protein